MTQKIKLSVKVIQSFYGKPNDLEKQYTNTVN